MFDALRRRSIAARSATTGMTQPEETLAALAALPPPGGLKPYDKPCADGKCYLSFLPSEVLTRIFLHLDRASLTKCYRLCKDLNEFLTTNSAISLHHTLLSNSLLLNPNALAPPVNADLAPPSKAELLGTLRERLTRFRNFKPKRSYDVEFKEDEGSLYEYLEGVLMRGIKPLRVGQRYVARELAIYDLRQLGEWEDEPDVQQRDTPVIGGGTTQEAQMEDDDGEVVVGEEQIAQDIRRAKKFDFDICEFAVDPGQDLLVIVEIRRDTLRRGYTMYFHLLSLETFEPHPLAKNKVLEWPEALVVPRIELSFQICDEGLFVIKHNTPDGPADLLCGWQWTTGRLGVTLHASHTVAFQSFVLISPSSFVVTVLVTHLDPHSENLGDLDNPIDLSWTNHLQLYAFPPFSSVALPTNPTEPMSPPHKATHVTTIDLPTFHVDIFNTIPPPRITIRTDPPPRHTFPTHPKNSSAQFVPTPESGVVILEFHCHLPRVPNPHYAMCLHKSTLAQYLPAPTSSLLFQAFPRPAPVVSWPTLAPYVRMFGPDLVPSSWVCYVYQNRYITHRLDFDLELQYLRLYDFDPIRVRKEICDRKYGNLPVGPAANDFTSTSLTASPTGSTTPAKRRRGGSLGEAEVEVDGDRDGIVLVTEETVVPSNTLLPQGLRTGSKMPYMYVEKRTSGSNSLIDAERVVIVHEEEEPWGEDSTRLEILEF